MEKLRKAGQGLGYRLSKNCQCPLNPAEQYSVPRYDMSYSCLFFHVCVLGFRVNMDFFECVSHPRRGGGGGVLGVTCRACPVEALNFNPTDLPSPLTDTWPP